MKICIQDPADPQQWFGHEKQVVSALLIWQTFIAAHLSQRTIWEKRMMMEVSKY